MTNGSPSHDDRTSQEDGLAIRFDGQRPRLRLVAWRLLGSGFDADEAVQEAWLRLRSVDATAIDNLDGWLTTVTARIALDMIRARERSAGPVDLQAAPDVVAVTAGPEDEAVLADSVSAALLLVLDSLTPAERLAFVLHDLFAVSFVEIGEVLQRSASASKMLASRARRKVQGEPARIERVPAEHRAVVAAFLDAARTGNLEMLVNLLHPEAVLRSDEPAVAMGSSAQMTGDRNIAGVFSGRALGAEAATIDGVVGLVWIVQGRPKVAWEFTIDTDRIVRIDTIADSLTLEQAQITSLV